MKKMYTEKQAYDLANYMLRKYGVKYEDHPEVTDSEGRPMTGPAEVSSADIANFQTEHNVTPLMPGQSIAIHTVGGAVIYAQVHGIEDKASKELSVPAEG